MVGHIAKWVDNRLAFSRSGRKMIDYIFPEQWSFLLGEIAAYAFIVLLVTGIFLTFFFVPGSATVIYHGSYAPLHNQPMSEAYRSVLDLSFNIRGGLLCRQAHHWAALIFIGAIVVHMGRVYFTGAFRRPRELNWMVGATLLLLAIMNGYLGYSLPGDLASGQGIRIGYSILESIPFVGSYLAEFLFHGQFPGSGISVERFFILHVLILPLAIMGLLGVHILMIIRPHHTQFKDADKRGDNVVGSPMFPSYAAKSTGLFFMVFSVILGLAAVVQINPIWQFGPYLPFRATDASQPDFYAGWLEGALRLWPNWEINLPGHMVPEQFFPAVLFPAVTWIGLYLVPFADRFLTGDKREHHLLARPRQHPGRTAFGVAMFTFYAVLFMAGGDDVLAHYFGIGAHEIVWLLRVTVFVAPLLAYAVTWRICHELGRVPIATASQRYVVAVRQADRSVALHELPREIEEPEPEPVELG